MSMDFKFRNISKENFNNSKNKLSYVTKCIIQSQNARTLFACTYIRNSLCLGTFSSTWKIELIVSISHKIFCSNINLILLDKYFNLSKVTSQRFTSNEVFVEQYLMFEQEFCCSNKNSLLCKSYIFPARPLKSAIKTMTFYCQLKSNSVITCL